MSFIIDNIFLILDVVSNKLLCLSFDKLFMTFSASSTSKIRNILSMINDIYNDTLHYKEDKIDNELKGRVQYLRMRIAYEAGREKIVMDFEKKAHLMDYIKEIGDNKQNLILFCHYMEALVAYHKYYGGKD